MSVRADKREYFKRNMAVWFKANCRDFPWRRTADPYRLLVAEMMLRRTRASQVQSVYDVFTTRFPTSEALAEAQPEGVAEILRPLGLTWRVPAFQLMAREAVTRYGGSIPLSRDELLTLPGVGDYVADAVRCFARDEPVAIADTNTVRVAGRYLGFQFGPESRRRKAVRDAIESLVVMQNPRESNLALLDFAATICKAVKPLCGKCPVADQCTWQTTGVLSRELPRSVTDS